MISTSGMAASDTKKTMVAIPNYLGVLEDKYTPSHIKSSTDTFDTSASINEEDVIEEEEEVSPTAEDDETMTLQSMFGRPHPKHVRSPIERKVEKTG